MAKIAKYAKVTQTGDKSGLSDVPENAPIWMQVTSTRENCLGQECPQHKECFVLKARKEAMEADIVVVNHHLFFADGSRMAGRDDNLSASAGLGIRQLHQFSQEQAIFGAFVFADY